MIIIIYGEPLLPARNQLQGLRLLTDSRLTWMVCLKLK